MTDHSSRQTQSGAAQTDSKLDREKFNLEKIRFKTDIVKWIVIAIGAVISFAVIEYGTLVLERSKFTAENERELLKSYLIATETNQPEIWKRKLRIIRDFTSEREVKDWAISELSDIENFAGLAALYRETLTVAAQLIEPRRLFDPKRVQARIRYNQLYWADLPYAGESEAVESAMFRFRSALIAAENAGAEAAKPWEELNQKLIELSRALRDPTPKRQ